MNDVRVPNILIENSPKKVKRLFNAMEPYSPRDCTFILHLNCFSYPFTVQLLYGQVFNCHNSTTKEDKSHALIAIIKYVLRYMPSNFLRLKD